MRKSVLKTVRDGGWKSCIKLLPLLLLLTLPSVVRAQFGYTTNIDNTITITSYTGLDSTVVIPNTIEGLPVTSIGNYSFSDLTGLTNVVIPGRVISIGDSAFEFCTNLAEITIPNSVTSMGTYVFANCISLTNVTIPNSITRIESSAFQSCISLTNITIPDSVTFLGSQAFSQCTKLSDIRIPRSVSFINDAAFFQCESLTNVVVESHSISIGSQAFNFCSKLKGIFFKGNAPPFGGDGTVFDNDPDVVIYYLPGTSGWGATFDGRPTAQWLLPNPTILNFGPNFGVQTNYFGFTISWATNVPVVVEACTNLFDPVWRPLQTNTLTSGWFYFSDSQWTNYPSRFYRLRSP